MESESKKKEGIVLYSMYRGPGPAYRLKTSIGIKDHCPTKSQAPAYTIGHKYSGLDISPGPGDYDTHNIRDGVISDEHRSPAISIGQRTKLPNKTEVPPPNTYDLKCGFLVRSQTAKNGPEWSLRGRSTVGGPHYSGTKADVPGPASYGPVSPAIYKPQSGTGFTIQGRTHVKDYTTLKDNPGPNSYNPGITYPHSAGRKGFTMGIRHSEFVIPMIASADKV